MHDLRHETYLQRLQPLREVRINKDDIEEDGAGFSAVQGSIGVYVEDADEYDTILFAKKDYYNETGI